ncbi:hypothetical protein B9Z19DRAFT_1091833 [Tuber borchii]|uniref:Uncharacterized protein n=1 Tax=Tuber borchii TaxID=42251 RepID=A0A2T6ZH64_TUBBO|nr:hypothetical protein B9Z19DRAFT_1091833 [Tuber borchii]
MLLNNTGPFNSRTWDLGLKRRGPQRRAVPSASQSGGEGKWDEWWLFSCRIFVLCGASWVGISAAR